MKRYIRLFEKLFNINVDVDIIYDKYFSWLIKDLLNGKRYNIGFVSGEFNSSFLISSKGKKTHSINPVKIYTGIFKEGSYYTPIDKIIKLSLNSHAISFLIQKNNDFTKAVNSLPVNRVKDFKNEFTLSRIKSAVAHELSHWIDDTLHGEHINKMLKKKNRQAIYQGKSNVSVTDYEIEATIHAIKQLKRDNDRIWNKITFDEMLSLDSTLNHLRKQLMSTPDEEKLWRKLILHRMNREKLLGNRMSKNE